MLVTVRGQTHKPELRILLFGTDMTIWIYLDCTRSAGEPARHALDCAHTESGHRPRGKQEKSSAAFVIAYSGARSEPCLGGPLEQPDPGGSGRRCHQGRTSRSWRRYPRMGTPLL